MFRSGKGGFDARFAAFIHCRFYLRHSPYGFAPNGGGGHRIGACSMLGAILLTLIGERILTVPLLWAGLALGSAVGFGWPDGCS